MNISVIHPKKGIELECCKTGLMWLAMTIAVFTGGGAYANDRSTSIENEEAKKWNALVWSRRPYTNIVVLSGTELLWNGVRCRLLGISEASDHEKRTKAKTFVEEWIRSSGCYFHFDNYMNRILDKDGMPLLWIGADVKGYLNVDLVRNKLVEADYQTHKEYIFLLDEQGNKYKAQWKEWLWEVQDPNTRSKEKPTFPSSLDDIIPSSEEIGKVLEKYWTVDKIAAYCRTNAPDDPGVSTSRPGPEAVRKGVLYKGHEDVLGAVKWKAGAYFDDDHHLLLVVSKDGKWWTLVEKNTFDVLKAYDPVKYTSPINPMPQKPAGNPQGQTFE